MRTGAAGPPACRSLRRDCRDVELPPRADPHLSRVRAAQRPSSRESSRSVGNFSRESSQSSWTLGKRSKSPFDAQRGGRPVGCSERAASRDPTGACASQVGADHAGRAWPAPGSMPVRRSPAWPSGRPPGALDEAAFDIRNTPSPGPIPPSRLASWGPAALAGASRRADGRLLPVGQWFSQRPQPVHGAGSKRSPSRLDFAPVGHHRRDALLPSSGARPRRSRQRAGPDPRRLALALPPAPPPLSP
jgi:hypothetical protein